jgi:hypothetical protein
MTSIRHAIAISSVALAAAACGSPNTGGAESTPSPSPASSPSAASCTTSGAAVNWPSPDTAPASAAITSVTAAGDVLTITFRQGTPEFEVAPQPDAHFTKDPSGQQVTLAGTAGVKITLRGFRGDVQNYAGPTSINSSGGLLVQVMEIGDSEGVVTWAAGVNGAACATVTASGSTLTFHFIHQTGA